MRLMTRPKLEKDTEEAIIDTEWVIQKIERSSRPLLCWIEHKAVVGTMR